MIERLLVVVLAVSLGAAIGLLVRHKDQAKALEAAAPHHRPRATAADACRRCQMLRNAVRRPPVSADGMPIPEHPGALSPVPRLEIRCRAHNGHRRRSGLRRLTGAR